MMVIFLSEDYPGSAVQQSLNMGPLSCNNAFYSFFKLKAVPEPTVVKEFYNNTRGDAIPCVGERIAALQPTVLITRDGFLQLVRGLECEQASRRGG